jgi:hypothetical protein
MVVTRRRGSLVAGLATLALVLAACGPTTTSPSAVASAAIASPLPAPSGPPVLGLDWGRAEIVERPEDAFAAPSPGASFAFSLGGNRSGHPLHFPGQAMMADVAILPSGGLASVGYVYPGWHPTSWTSSDGRTWALHPIADTEFTFPVAMAAGADGHLVAVGRSGSSPLLDVGGRHGLAPHHVAILGDGSVAERMTTVVATPDSSRGRLGRPELLDRHARFWTSPTASTGSRSPTTRSASRMPRSGRSPGSATGTSRPASPAASRTSPARPPGPRPTDGPGRGTTTRR